MTSTAISILKALGFKFLAFLLASNRTNLKGLVLRQIHVILMFLVTFFNAGAAAKHAVLASRVEAEHVEELPIVKSLLFAGEIFYFGDGLHAKLSRY